MVQPTLRKRIWGWFFFDWASQPYNTLLLTFIFAPYVNELMQDGAAAQAAWGFGIGTAGFVIAMLAPILGAISDTSGNRMRFVWLFSAFYVVGSFGLWWAAPESFNLYLTLVFFAIGMIGMEFATIAPDLSALNIPADIAPAFWDMARENVETRKDIAPLSTSARGRRSGATPATAGPSVMSADSWRLS